MNKDDLIKTLPISRRVFSKMSLTGLLMTAAPLHAVYAQTGQKGVAKRFMAYVIPGGVWHPAFCGGDESGIVFNEAVKPLEPYKDQIVAFKGLSNKAATNRQHHQRGMTSILTGFRSPGFTKAAAARLSTEPSIDQIIAKQIGKNTFFSSIEAGMVDCGSASFISRMSYSSSQTTRNPIDKAQPLFDKLFKGRDFSGGGTTSPDPENTRRKSALDGVMQQIALMEKELVGSDKERMQQHLSAVEEIERRIDVGGMTIGQCGAPTNRPGDLDPHAETDLIADMTAYALACGLTNVATLQGNRAGSTATWEFLKEWTDHYGPNGARHHDITHSDNFRSDGAKNAFKAVDRFWMSKLARMLKILSETPEDGGSMLDNTVIFFGTPISQPQGHSHNNLRWMLLGGKGLNRWQTNRFVHANGEIAHNLHVSMMQACGLPNTTIGNDPETRGHQPLSVL